MRFLFPLLFPLLGLAFPRENTLLFQAEQLFSQYANQIEKLPIPSTQPKTDIALSLASNWIEIPLENVLAPATYTLAKEPFFSSLREIGFDAIFLPSLKRGGENRTGFGVDPKWGNHWKTLSLLLEKKGFSLIADSFSDQTGLCPDFFFALQNQIDYQGLYELIEIEEKDWNLLPKISPSRWCENIPWFNLSKLQKKGYLPQEGLKMYGKKSLWNATSQITGVDGKKRRWIYLAKSLQTPFLSWLNPSFSALKIGSMDLFFSKTFLGEKITFFSPKLKENTTQTLIQFTKRIGNFSVCQKEPKKSDEGSDFFLENDLERAFLQSFIYQNGVPLHRFYASFLQGEKTLQRLVHKPPSFGAIASLWQELSKTPKKYPDEAIIDAFFTQKKYRKGPFSESLDPGVLEKDYPHLLSLCLMSAHFYAMQPGALLFSIFDLLGVSLPDVPIDPTSHHERFLFGSLSAQKKNHRSFTLGLKKILNARQDSQIAKGKLIDVFLHKEKGLFFLLFESPKPNILQLLALNCQPYPQKSALEIPRIQKKIAIDLLSGLSQEKETFSPLFSIELPPFSAKSILFLPHTDID